MGDSDYMQSQIEEKIKNNFTCIKLKIEPIGILKEILKSLRQKFPKNKIELVDANGAFSPEQAKIVLQELAALDIHSIEQPIKAGDWEAMAELL
jgi:L-alanine-DL-glutamate epimerase-like enolase superfamily enzyme